jgi:drug/metabolite transporter (DMT)-like permease
MSRTVEIKAWLTLLFLSIIWGTSFILIKKALITFTPVQVAILRIAIAGIAFSPFFFYHIRRLEWHRWKFYIVIALTGSGIPAVLYATAQTKMTSATAGILNTLTPIFALIIGVLVFKNKIQKRQLLGITLGFLGACNLILLDSSASGQKGSVLYGLLIVLGSLCYGANVNLVKAYFQKVRPIELSSFAFFLLGIPAILILPFTDIPYLVVNDPHGIESLSYLVILALFSTVFALVIFYRLVQQTDAVFGSSVAYLIPIVALFWGLLDGEPLGLMHFVLLVIILIGVYLGRANPSTV